MTPLTTVADVTDIYTARTVMEALRKAGWIVVRHDAIRLAQREAHYAALEDVRMGLVRADNGDERDQPQRRAA